MNTLGRLLKHLFTTKGAARRAFPADTLKAIQAAIAAGERLHRAEVRFIIEPALAPSAVLRGQHSRQRARELFARYRVWDTEENCGVLIYLNLADHKVEIIGDRAVGRALGAKDWQAVCQTMTQGFASGQYHEGAVAGVEQLNALLQDRFPDDGARRNQLSDRPIVL